MQRKLFLWGRYLLAAFVLLSLTLSFPIKVSAMDVLYEEYWPGTESPELSGLGTWQLGQTFTATATHSISAVEFLLAPMFDTAPVNVTVSLKAVDYNTDLPTGPVLATATVEIPGDSEIISQMFYFNPPYITVDEHNKYAILLSQSESLTVVGIARDNPGSYAGGIKLMSSNGSTWSKQSGDLWFKVYAEELPKPQLLWTYPVSDDVTDVAVGNLNDNATDEVAGVDTPPSNDTLHVLDGDGGIKWFEPLDGFSVTVGDIDGDGKKEVIAAGTDHNTHQSGIFAYKDNGTDTPVLLWFYPDQDRITDIEIGDIDNDAFNDVVACDLGGSIFAIDGTGNNGDGVDLPGWPVSYPDEYFMDVAVGQLDGHNGMDVAAIGEGMHGSLFALDSSGQELWPEPQGIDGHSVEIGNVDSISGNEVVAGTNYGSVYAYAGGSGTLLYSFTGGWSPVTDVELGDLNGNMSDGLEIAAIYSAIPNPDTIYALNIDNLPGLQEMWHYDMAWNSYYYGEALAIGDVDHDYKNEVVACSSGDTNRVYAFDGLNNNNDSIGDMVWSPYDVSDFGDVIINDLEIGDLDGDGDQDVVIGTSERPAGGAAIIALANSDTETTSSTYSGKVYFDSDPSSLENLEAIKDTDLPENKPNYSYPHGFFSFSINGLELGQTATVTVTLPTKAPVGTKWVKYQNGQWLVKDIGDDDGDNVITFTVKDGSNPVYGDADLTENGKIIDPGAPAYPPQFTPKPMGVGGEVSGVNRLEVIAPWLIFTFVLGIGSTALVLVRRKG